MEWIDNYIKFLGCIDPMDIRVEEAMEVKGENLPSKLYKYREATDYAIDNLTNNTVWLNKPSEYNDPFEFAEFIDFSQLQKSINSNYNFDVIESFSKQYPIPNEIKYKAKNTLNPLDILIDFAFEKEGRTESEISIYKKAMYEVLKNEYAKMQQWKIDSMQDQMKVCSFCESHEQLLMWSHYTKNHTGFCVEYNISQWQKDDIRRRILYPVIYQKQRYDATQHLMQDLNGNDGFNPLYSIISGSTKSLEWIYEKEWRFIFNIGDSFPSQNYQMNCQTKVFLGYRMQNERKLLIINICNEKRIPVYQATPSVDLYKLEFKEIK